MTLHRAGLVGGVIAMGGVVGKVATIDVVWGAYLLLALALTCVPVANNLDKEDER